MFDKNQLKNSISALQIQISDYLGKFAGFGGLIFCLSDQIWNPCYATRDGIVRLEAIYFQAVLVFCNNSVLQVTE